MVVKKIGSEPDSTGAIVTATYMEAIGGSRIVPVLMKNFVKLIEDGHAGKWVTFNNKSKAVYIEIDNKIVGHIVYDHRSDDLFKTAWIILSWVDENYRRRGLYKILHKYFEKVLKETGSTKIASYVSVNNAARLASCESVGMIKHCYRMEKHLEQNDWQ